MMDRLESFDSSDLMEFIAPPKIKIVGVGGEIALIFDGILIFVCVVFEVSVLNVALSIPEEVSITLGTGFPTFGFKESPLVEKPPSLFKSNISEYSSP